MNISTPLFSIVGLAAAGLLGLGAVQEKKQEPPKGQEGMEMPMPQPTPHHAALKTLAGTWEATVKMTMMPGAPPTESKGIETNTMIGEFWLMSDFKGDFMGMPFHGTGVAGYDSDRKKHVGTWVDSMGAQMAVSEGTCDGTCKTVTTVAEVKDMQGKMVKQRMVGEMRDNDNRTLRMYMPGPDGKDFEGMTITYKRKK